MRKDVCPPDYEPGERTTSRTRGHLSPDVTQFDGRLLIADFGVNRSLVKRETKQEKLLKDSLATFERDKGLRFRIVGYTDCIGLEKGNRKLRQDRAKEVFRLLGSSARSRVVSVGPAQPGTFVPGTDNGTLEGRARNRSVVIEFWRDSEAEKSTEQPAPSPPPWSPWQLPESVKKRMEKEAEGPMETERRRRDAEKKRWAPVPAPRRKSLKDQVRERLRAEGVPDWAIDQLFKTAAPAGRLAANVALNRMKISDAARQFVRERLQEIYSWRF
jgi:outer membrane protein OmpA-like peptidoglycan-associated protein